jgi:hypothetical protein
MMAASLRIEGWLARRLPLVAPKQIQMKVSGK